MSGTNSQMAITPKLKESYIAVRAYTEKLCEPLEIEDYIPQPSIDVSPPKWNIAHTTWFFEEMILKKYVPGYEVFDENFGFLFNSYYNSIGTRTVRDHRGDLSRPTVKHVFEYRTFVDQNMIELLSGELSAELEELVILGINHEQQHQELLLADLKYTLSVNPLFPVYHEDFTAIENAESKAVGFAEIEGGIYEIGYSGEDFHFDNELGRHKAYLQDFSISRYLVTNAEYLIFIADGGYKDFRYWHSEGWDWVNQNAVDSPLYWHQRDGEWFNFTLGGLNKLHLDAPVSHISFYEAAAFAEYKGMRLPTEFEWETASERFDWGLRWEWTASAYLP